MVVVCFALTAKASKLRPSRFHIGYFVVVLHNTKTILDTFVTNGLQKCLVHHALNLISKALDFWGSRMAWDNKIPEPKLASRETTK